MKKSIIAFVLAAAMALSLAGCGSTAVAPATQPEQEQAPEYIYKASYAPIERDGRDNGTNIFTKDGFYSFEYVKSGQRTLNEGETLEYEGQLDIWEPELWFYGFDGSSRKLENFVPLEVPSANPKAEDGQTVTAYVNGFDITPAGNLMIACQVFESWFEGPEGSEYTEEYYNSYGESEKYFVRVLDKTGAELSCSELEKPGDGYFSVYHFRAADENSFIVPCDEYIHLFGTDGKLLNSVRIAGWVQSVFTGRDGSVMVSVFDDGPKICVLDPKTLEYTKTYKAPINGYDFKNGSGEYDAYYSNGAALYGYSCQTEESTYILSWLNCDVNDDSLSGYLIMDDGSIVGLSNDYTRDGVKSNFVTISKVPYDPSMKKTTLTLAAMFLEYDLKNAVIDFNRSSDTCRIEVIDYEQYNKDDDYEAGMKKLSTEIMAGQAPDIICVPNLPIKQLAAKGRLADLYPYLDKDKEMSRSDYFESVLKAAEIDGKLLFSIPNFSIRTAIGATSVVGDGSSWTYEDLDRALASMPEGCKIFNKFTTQDSMLSTLLSIEGDRYVDWSTGKCSFDSPEFVKLLEFVNRFPSEFDWDNYEWSEDESEEAMIASGRQMLVETFMYDFSDFAQYELYFGAGNYSFVGYPGYDSGSVIQINRGYAISESCKDKDAAWSFIRTFFTEKYQSETYGLPLSRKAFESKLAEEMEPIYRYDENGNKLLDENGEPILDPRWIMIDQNGEEFKYYGTTREQADQLIDLIERTDKIYNYDDTIFSLVSELAKTYFSGQKTAEEAAKLIQSKATIYVNEQR